MTSRIMTTTINNFDIEDYQYHVILEWDKHEGYVVRIFHEKQGTSIWGYPQEKATYSAFASAVNFFTKQVNKIAKENIGVN